MALVDRVKAILLSPKTEWPVIEGEGGDVAGIYKNYLIYLAAIPAIAGFIGLSLIGMNLLGNTFRIPFGAGIAQALVGFVMSLVMTYVLAWIANALAPTFGGQQNMLSAFKLIAYGTTAALVAGIFQLIPSLGILAFLGALYTIYLIYIGVPVMMKCPPDKALAYTAVLIVCGIIAGVIAGAVAAFFVSMPSGLGSLPAGIPGR
jgi:Yip1 domain